MTQGARLVCLPPAGGGPSLFRAWRAIPGLAIETPGLPGREGRFREPPASSLAALADRVAEETAPRLGGRFALFGYSMGGVLALLLAERLARRGLPGPEALFVLGSAPPDRLNAAIAGLHARESAAFWAEIARIGGTPAAVIASAEMRELFEPALRADFRLCETYRHADRGFRLDCPVHVFLAEADHLVHAEDAAAWAGHSRGPTRVRRIPGGHMLDPAAFAALGARIAALWPQGAAGGAAGDGAPLGGSTGGGTTDWGSTGGGSTGGGLTNDAGLLV